ncbi:MAG TPA: methyl-accepting chemotaxis protein [Allocoleopsis sp.]
MRKINLQTKLIGSFLLMGTIVLVVGWIGWSGSIELSKHINTFSQQSMPSVLGLWQLNEAQTAIESSERLLLDPQITASERAAALEKINQSWQQVDQGFKRYEPAPRTSEENILYTEKFVPDWEKWKQIHKKVLVLEEQYHQFNMRNPWLVQANLLLKDKNINPAAMSKIQQALALREQMDKLMSEVERPAFLTVEKDLLKLIDINEKVGEDADQKAQKDAYNIRAWTIVGMMIGTGTAIVLGIVLSIGIAKPLDNAVNHIISMIASSATEIAATIEEQERISNQQASSVNETTTTIDQLGVSSKQSAQQAFLGSQTANQILDLVQEGNSVVGKTIEEMETLQEKVTIISNQIRLLSDQANQITGISTLVSDLANQTNMLALNAAVEAVRAGEQGKGFAVVASEIRKLADASKKSAEKINNLIREIQTAINSTVKMSETSSQSVTQSMNLSQQTVGAFNSVAMAISDIVLQIDQISLNSKQQATAIDQVVIAMNNINTGSRENVKGIGQAKVGAAQLREAAHGLQSLGLVN